MCQAYSDLRPESSTAVSSSANARAFSSSGIRSSNSRYPSTTKRAICSTVSRCRFSTGASFGSDSAIAMCVLLPAGGQISQPVFRACIHWKVHPMAGRRRVRAPARPGLPASRPVGRRFRLGRAVRTRYRPASELRLRRGFRRTEPTQLLRSSDHRSGDLGIGVFGARSQTLPQHPTGAGQILTALTEISLAWSRSRGSRGGVDQEGLRTFRRAAMDPRRAIVSQMRSLFGPVKQLSARPPTGNLTRPALGEMPESNHLRRELADEFRRVGKDADVAPISDLTDVGAGRRLIRPRGQGSGATGRNRQGVANCPHLALIQGPHVVAQTRLFDGSHVIQIHRRLPFQSFPDADNHVALSPPDGRRDGSN